jgi:O-antigen/teichoic acid export membrane protein
MKLSMLGNSVAVMIAKAATMALGFAFWLIATQRFDVEHVGIAAAVVSAMMLCTQIALVGVGAAVVTELPRHLARPTRLLDSAFSVAVLGSLAIGGLFVLLASALLGELGIVGSAPAYVIVFLVMCVLGTVGIVLDQVSISLRRGDYVLTRGLVFGICAVALVAFVPRGLDDTGSLAVVAPWAGAAIAACVLGVVQLRRSSVRYRFRPRADRTLTPQLIRIGLPNYALTLTERAPGLILPVLVTELLSPALNAAWYTAWMMAWVLYFIPISVGLALFAEASHRPDDTRAIVRSSLRSALAIGVPAACALTLLAPTALSLLGPAYAQAGTDPLRVLAWAVVPIAFVQAYFAASRAARRLREAVVVGAISGTAAVLLGAAAGAAFGLTAMAVAWLCVQLVTGAWAFGRLRAMAADASPPAAFAEPATA